MIVMLLIGGVFAFFTLLSFMGMRRKIRATQQQAESEINRLSFMLSEAQGELQKRQNRFEELVGENSFLKATLEQEQKQSFEKIKLLQEAEERLQAQFKAISSEIFREHNRHFLEMADSKFRASMEQTHSKMNSALSEKQQALQNLVQPIQQALNQVDGKIQALEKERVGAYENLKTQVHHLIDSQKELRTETANLVKALRAPQVRGKWGEMQLRRVVEMAGMVEHCDFIEQVSVEGEDGRLRPDMIVRLPGGSQIVVDAKAPLMAYLDAMESTDEKDRELKLLDHARHVRNHIKALSQRSYSDQFEKSPDFVVLFLPGEMFFSAALEKDPELLEMGFKDRVILATPTTLIALLRAVAYGWRQESLAENARAISQLGQEMSKRVSDLADHMLKLGRNIGQVVESYNQTVGTLERRVLVSARKFKELDVSCEEISPVVSLSHIPRELQTLEMTGEKSDNGDNLNQTESKLLGGLENHDRRTQHGKIKDKSEKNLPNFLGEEESEAMQQEGNNDQAA